MGTDAIVMRHSAEGAPLYATKAVDPIRRSIFPQVMALMNIQHKLCLDMYSILRKKNPLKV